MKTKKELIKMYESGKLKDTAYYSESAFDGMVIIEANSEYVFGYYVYHNFDKEEKTFFKRKIYSGLHDETFYFNYNNIRYHLSDFIRIGFGSMAL